MDNNLSHIILAVLLVGIAGLTGGLLPSSFVRKNLSSLLAFAAGTLLGTAFLNLLPEALAELKSINEIFQATLVGFVLFYFIQSFLGSHATGQSGHKHSAIGPLVLLGDAIHNATDGMAIAAAFSINTKLGIATTLAVIVHELPQEVGDYSILISHGYSRLKALFSLFLVQLTALLGALLSLWFFTKVHEASVYMMAVSAGGFVYIAAADLLPELQKQKQNQAYTLVAFLMGILVIVFVQSFF